MSFSPLFNPNVRVKYRDPHAYPSLKIVTSEPPKEVPAKSAIEQGENKKSRKRKADGTIDASSTKKSVPMAGQMAMWQKKHTELQGQGTSQEGGTSSGLRTQGKPESKGPITISLSKVKMDDNVGSTVDNNGPDHGPAPSAEDAERTLTEDGTNDGAAVSYVDRDRFMCLICMRKYKSMDEVNIHEKSRNHKTATENEELVTAALARIASRNKKIQKQPSDQDAEQSATSQYRDRAKERRQAFSQPQKPVNPVKDKPRQDTSAKQAEAKPTPSKGAGMMAKMGWTSGAGLGANEDGRTEAVASNAYQEGVGLGAEGSNLGDAAQLAERKTRNSYADYVNTVQDKARQRYQNMD